jgi:hypothetical protein
MAGGGSIPFVFRHTGKQAYVRVVLALNFAQNLPLSQVTVDNSNDPRIADCMACQVALYSRTNVLVGLHGAGKAYQQSLRGCLRLAHLVVLQRLDISAKVNKQLHLIYVRSSVPPRQA